MALSSTEAPPQALPRAQATPGPTAPHPEPPMAPLSIFSWNCNGLSDPLKPGLLRAQCNEHQPSLLLLQEAKPEGPAQELQFPATFYTSPNLDRAKRRRGGLWTGGKGCPGPLSHQVEHPGAGARDRAPEVAWATHLGDEPLPGPRPIARSL